ncbi:hypothetical protein CC86DRAFT_463379 [Ophiobolus disseminans]|uniref:endo-1,3(4)-beta-glucanase n=1 Tax=Ophiobolus disseminans TaxID=1469910 RepID=A0A6A7AE16_9PLEO|nr:hypothetical protein CC86DRAFT_463379 [Ophiobolus disseminans]
MHFSTTLVSAAALFEFCIAGYVLEDDYMTDFYGNFDFFTGQDPTEGFVQYVDEATARKTNLIKANSSTAAVFGVDVVNKTPKGRPSIRIESKKKYDSGLIVLDVAHMPFGCGTWPAFWTLGPNWPKGGEIDILEGVNEYTNNGMTLHTGPGCSIGNDATQFSGNVTTPNCDVAAEGQLKNVGCSIEHPSKQSYGAGLNQNGGGVYATSWNSDAISVYFFPRESIPADVLGDNPDPSAWGKPAAKFEGACDIDKMFAEQQIIIDTTFCGQWAGKIWEDGSCAKKAKTCVDYVRDNPEAFTEAYWEINALKVYQDDGKPGARPSPPATPPKSSVISIPVPVSTINGNLSTIVAPVSSKVVLPSSSKLASSVPAKPTLTPAVPLPSGNATAPSALPPKPTITPPSLPLPSGNSSAPGLSPPGNRTRVSARPSRPLNTQIAAPSGAGGMPGWQWPNFADGDTPASPPKSNSTAIAPTPTSRLSAAQVSPSKAPPAVPFVPANEIDAPVRTVYQTLYVTKTAEAGAGETPVSDGVKARMARHFREHRRRGERGV